VNTAVLKLFAEDNSAYQPPETTRTALREYHFDREMIEKTFGDSLHVFLLDIPRLDFGMIVPKGDYVSVCLLGRAIDENLIQAFLTAPVVKASFPEGWQWDQPACQCMPRVNVRAARHPYGNRVVFIGDSGVTRLYKDGLGAAYRAAKAAATCAVLNGVSAEDFQRYYAPFCQRIETDNRFGKLIFFVTHGIQRLRFARKALIRTMSHEQRESGKPQHMSSVLWDTFTGSAPYTDVFLRMLHPAFFGGFLWRLIDAWVRG
jgi:flavin-dependent dehydrogenase